MPHPCPACGSPVEQRHDVGRPRVYCSDSCRSAAARRRREAEVADEIRAAADVLRSLAAAASMTTED